MIQYIIYNKPKDFPNHYVIRSWCIEDILNAQEIIGKADSLEEIRQKLPENLIKLPIYEEDDPVISEVWTENTPVAHKFLDLLKRYSGHRNERVGR